MTLIIFIFIVVVIFIQQLRKLVLELIHRLPANDNLKGHVKVHVSFSCSSLLSLNCIGSTFYNVFATRGTGIHVVKTSCHVIFM